MGISLSSPETDKSSEDDEGAELRFGLSALQGWRESMDDAGLRGIWGSFFLNWEVVGSLLAAVVLVWKWRMCVSNSTHSALGFKRICCCEHNSRCDLVAGQETEEYGKKISGSELEESLKGVD